MPDQTCFRTDAHHTCGDSDHGGIILDRPHHHRTSADFDVISNTDIAEHFRAGAHDDAIANRGMALASLISCTTQRYALIQEAIITDFGCLADHHSKAVIYEKATADRSSWVDLDSGKEAADLREDARDQRDTPPVELMGQAVNKDGVESGVTEQDLC